MEQQQHRMSAGPPVRFDLTTWPCIGRASRRCRREAGPSVTLTLSIHRSTVSGRVLGLADAVTDDGRIVASVGRLGDEAWAIAEVGDDLRARLSPWTPPLPSASWAVEVQLLIDEAYASLPARDLDA